MAIGAPSIICQTKGEASGAASSPTTADVPAGSLIVLAVLNDSQGNSPITAVRDSAGNEYQQAVQSAPQLQHFCTGIFFLSDTPGDLPAGSTFTVETAGGTYDLVALAIAGANGGLDATKSVNGFGNSASLATGALASASEIIISVMTMTSVLVTWTPGAGFATLVDNHGNGSWGANLDFKIVSSPAGVNDDPSWDHDPQNYAAVLASFKVTPAVVVDPIPVQPMPRVQPAAPQGGDLRLAWNPEKGQADLVLMPDGSLDAGHELETAVIISLFSDARAQPGDEKLYAVDPRDPRGWWGDAYADVAGDRLGSRLWLLERAKSWGGLPLVAEGFCREALQWMIDDGVASEVDVVCFFPTGFTSRLDANIEIVRGDGSRLQLKYESLWKELGS